MRQLLYVSNAAQKFPPKELDAILAASRRNNASRDVTGMLLYIDGGFLQVLEGPDESVAATYARICRDKRHWDARTLLDREAPRAFANWSMGFEKLEKGRAATDDMFEITREAIEGRPTPGAAREITTLLRTFCHVQSGNNAKLADG